MYVGPIAKWYSCSSQHKGVRLSPLESRWGLYLLFTGGMKQDWCCAAMSSHSSHFAFLQPSCRAAKPLPRLAHWKAMEWDKGLPFGPSCEVCVMKSAMAPTMTAKWLQGHERDLQAETQLCTNCQPDSWEEINSSCLKHQALGWWVPRKSEWSQNWGLNSRKLLLSTIENTWPLL